MYNQLHVHQTGQLHPQWLGDAVILDTEKLQVIRLFKKDAGADLKHLGGNVITDKEDLQVLVPGDKQAAKRRDAKNRPNVISQCH